MARIAIALPLGSRDPRPCSLGRALRGGPLIIGYDGSGPAQAAIGEAARLFRGHEVVVVTGWSSLAGAAPATRIALPDDIVRGAIESLEAASQATARDTAQEGADMAREAGMVAVDRIVEAEPNVWSALLRVADDIDAAAIIVGSRGRSGIRSIVLGSVSAGVVQHSARPVVIVHDHR
jgi:nucleotide-binding universal stress UspA family protein